MLKGGGGVQALMGLAFFCSCRKIFGWLLIDGDSKLSRIREGNNRLIVPVLLVAEVIVQLREATAGARTIRAMLDN